eukprot:COSAG01_NODE_5050_length_4524_cov_189.554802_1_plen_55_part_10
MHPLGSRRVAAPSGPAAPPLASADGAARRPLSGPAAAAAVPGRRRHRRSTPCSRC